MPIKNRTSHIFQPWHPRKGFNQIIIQGFRHLGFYRFWQPKTSGEVMVPRCKLVAAFNSPFSTRVSSWPPLPISIKRETFRFHAVGYPKSHNTLPLFPRVPAPRCHIRAAPSPAVPPGWQSPQRLGAGSKNSWAPTASQISLKIRKASIALSTRSGGNAALLPHPFLQPC